MLAIKLLEMGGNRSLQNEDGKKNPAILAAMWVGWASVFGFGLWFLAQGQAFPNSIKPTGVAEIYQSEAECIAAAQTYDDLDACKAK
ncbi:hypothetical protein [Synechococcus phage Yong-M3-232]|nr:hypothetical protein [Synechococcus phage Yong-M3-232]